MAYLLDKIIERKSEFFVGDNFLIGTKEDKASLKDTYHEIWYIKKYLNYHIDEVSPTKIQISKFNTPTSYTTFKRVKIDKETITFQASEEILKPIYEYMTGIIHQPSHLPALILSELKLGTLYDTDLELLSQYGVDEETLNHLKAIPLYGSYIEISAASVLWTENPSISLKEFFLMI